MTRSKLVELGEELVHLVLQCGDVILHLLELGGILEGVRTAVGRIDTLEIEVPAAVAWCLSIAFDLSPLAFVAGDGDIPIALGAGVTATGMVFSLSLLGLRARLG